MSEGGIERSGPCDRCYSTDDLIAITTIVNGIEQKEWVCSGCEPEAREDEKPPLRADGGTAEDGIDQFGSVVPGFKVRGMEPERNIYDFLISVDADFADELRSLDVPEKQEGATEHIKGALTHDMADVRFVGDSFLLHGITVGFQATGLDLYKEDRGRQKYATHNVDTSSEAIEVIAAFSRWEELASHVLEDTEIEGTA